MWEEGTETRLSTVRLEHIKLRGATDRPEERWIGGALPPRLKAGFRVRSRGDEPPAGFEDRRAVPDDGAVRQPDGPGVKDDEQDHGSLSVGGAGRLPCPGRRRNAFATR